MSEMHTHFTLISYIVVLVDCGSGIFLHMRASLPFYASLLLKTVHKIDSGTHTKRCVRMRGR